MRITNITLSDFRNHVMTDLALAPLTIVKGKNAAGKTSIRHALEVALTGRAEFTDRGGRGLVDAIRVGAKKATIAIGIESLGEVHRNISPSGSMLQISDWTGTATAQQDLLYQKLGADGDLISALLNVSQFIALPPRDQKDMLFALARPEISAGQLMGAVNDYAEKQGAGNLLDVLRGLIQIPETVGPDWLDQAYKLIFSARTEAKKDRDTLAGRVEGLAEVPTDLPPLDQLDKLASQIATLEGQRDTLTKKVAAVQAAEGRRAALVKEEEATRNSLEAYVEAEKYLTETDPVPLGARHGEILGELERVRGESHEAQGEIRAIDAALPVLKKAKGDCPLAPGLVKCTMTADDRKALVKDFGAKRKQLVSAHEKAMAETEKLICERDKIETELETAKEAEDNAEKKAYFVARLEEVQSELAALPEAVGLDLVRSEITSLAERIDNGKEMAARMKVAAEGAERLAVVRETAAEASAMADSLEALAILFGPTGIKAKLLSSTMGAVIERAAENLSLITGGLYELDAQADPDFHLIVNGNIELRQLSTSERMRVGIACAEALAHASGLRLLVIDDLEILDVGNRGLLSEWLRGRMADHDTVIVLSTAEDAKDPGIEGVSTYWVQDGKVERVGTAVGVGA